MGGFIEKIRNWWLQSSQTQRITTMGGIGLTIVLLVGIFTVASRPRFAMMYSGLTETEQGNIVAELQGQGVPVKYDIPGQIEVPADRVHELRMRLTSTGKAPKGAHLGLEDLGSLNAMVPPSQERERITAILEGEIAKDIETNPGVQAAKVHVTVGNDSPFLEQKRPSTASISLVTSGNGAVTHEAAKGIGMLVANAFPGLELKHVVVLDERAQTLFNGNEMDATDSQATTKLDMEQSIARKEEQRMQAALDAMFGTGSTRVTVRCEVDMDQKHVHEEKQVSKKGIETQFSDEKMVGAGAGPAASAGSDANRVSGAPAASPTKDNDTYTNHVAKIQPNTTVTETDSTVAPGTIKSEVINVAADSSEKRFGDPTKLQQLKDFVATEFATKAGSKAFVAKVTPIAFDDSTHTQVAQAQTEAASSARLQQIMSMLPIAALLIVGIMVVKQIGKMSKPVLTTVATPEGQVIQIPVVNGQIPTGYAMVANDPVEPEPQYSRPPKRDLSRFTEEELAQMAEDGVIYRENDEIVEVEKIREKKSVHLAAIKQMAKDRPEPTAMLIKTWLAETPTR